MLQTAIYMAAQLFSFIFALRFMLQLCSVDFYNPLSQSIVTITNPVTQPLRKIFPQNKLFDPASLVILLIINAFYVGLTIRLGGHQVPITAVVAAGGVLSLISLFNVLRLSIVAEVILSWLGPAAHQSPLFPVVFRINSPIMNQVRRVIPPMGGLDLSPMIVLFVIHFVVIGFLQNALVRAF